MDNSKSKALFLNKCHTAGQMWMQWLTLTGLSASISSECKNKVKRRQEKLLQPFGELWWSSVWIDQDIGPWKKKKKWTRWSQEWSEVSVRERGGVLLFHLHLVREETGQMVNHYRDWYDGRSHKVSGTEGSESKQAITEGEREELVTERSERQSHEALTRALIIGLAHCN